MFTVRHDATMGHISLSLSVITHLKITYDLFPIFILFSVIYLVLGTILGSKHVPTHCSEQRSLEETPGVSGVVLLHSKQVHAYLIS